MLPCCRWGQPKNHKVSCVLSSLTMKWSPDLNKYRSTGMKSFFPLKFWQTPRHTGLQPEGLSVHRRFAVFTCRRTDATLYSTALSRSQSHHHLNAQRYTLQVRKVSQSCWKAQSMYLMYLYVITIAMSYLKCSVKGSHRSRFFLLSIFW